MSCQDEVMFKYVRRVHVYETDMMGIVHHSNYLRFCEEARVEFCKHFELLDLEDAGNSKSSESVTPAENEKLNEVSTLAVLNSKVDYRQPLRFHDQVQIAVQGKQVGVRLILQYKIFKITDEKLDLCSLAETEHCAVQYRSGQMRVVKPTREYLEKVKGLPWTETWL